MNKLFENLEKGDKVVLTNRVQRKLAIVRSVRSRTVVLENNRVFDLTTGKAKDGSLNRIEPYSDSRDASIRALKTVRWEDIPDNVLIRIINILSCKINI